MPRSRRPGPGNALVFSPSPSPVWPERRTIHLLAASIGPSCGFFTISFFPGSRLLAPSPCLPFRRLNKQPVGRIETGLTKRSLLQPAPLQREGTCSNLRLLCPLIDASLLNTLHPSSARFLTEAANGDV
ncbi:hypothetical protein Q7C36_014144 [Tachysurus vachellii]|uniref:Uncharacterized protein n=1 Tax=Tachysurus vachellii TaxID=175792 RepID=A0AA88MEG0_TACVA|nr:hypothetical protein Q7C36_014144 [Tachysurus vachellii]